MTAEKIYQFVAGVGVNSVVTGLSANMAVWLNPSEDVKKNIRNACIGGAIGSTASIFIGNWIRKKDCWKIAGLTQMAFGGLTLLASFIGLALVYSGQIPQAKSASKIILLREL